MPQLTRIFKINCLLIFFSLLCTSCSQEQKSIKPSEKLLHIAMGDDPLSLDPRLTRDLPTASVMRMLFEGLTRMDSQGKPVFAIAENVSISNDQKTYTFKLRPSQWSDGSPLTAEDFEQTWKLSLSPTFPAPNANQFYMIKGAKEAKEGKISTDEVGIKTTSPDTLIVELETPTPYFLELTSCHYYFPVNARARQDGNITPTTIVGNGPFKFDQWQQRNTFQVVKNPNYWDANAVQLEGVHLHILDEQTSLQLFNAGKLDWAGSPLNALPQDAIALLKQQNKLHITPAAGTHWFRFNTSQVPLNNRAFRRALSLALNRQAIVDHVTQGLQSPAIGIVPPSFGFVYQNYYTDHDTQNAKLMLNLSLSEMGLTLATLPPLVLTYSASDRNHKITQTVQQQWLQTLGLNVKLEGLEFKVALDKIRNGSYQIGMGSWYADIQDPINFLEVFKTSTTSTNLTFWSNPVFTMHLDEYLTELDSKKQSNLLNQAEKILIAEMPVAPLFHGSFNHVQNPHLKRVYLSPLGHIDFKEAYFTKEKP